MTDREKVVKGLKCCCGTGRCFHGCPYHEVSQNIWDCTSQLALEALDLLKDQEEIKEQFIEAFNTIRDAYNTPANREKILLNYLLRNACCCK